MGIKIHKQNPDIANGVRIRETTRRAGPIKALSIEYLQIVLWSGLSDKKADMVRLVVTIQG